MLMHNYFSLYDNELSTEEMINIKRTKKVVAIFCMLMRMNYYWKNIFSRIHRRFPTELTTTFLLLLFFNFNSKPNFCYDEYIISLSLEEIYFNKREEKEQINQSNALISHILSHCTICTILIHSICVCVWE